MKKNIILTMLIALALAASAQNRRSFTGTLRTPTVGNSTFELFQDRSDSNGRMNVINSSASFGGNWSDISNTLIRESARDGQANSRSGLNYTYNIRSISGNVFHGGYGWWSQNSEGDQNIVEFYVVEGWVNRADPIFGMTKTSLSYTADGGTYEVYFSEKRGLPSVFGIRNFLQIKAVRTANKGRGKKRGRISFKRHFDQWRSFSREPRNRQNSSIRKFGSRGIHEISYLFEGFGGEGSPGSSVNFSANATFFGLSNPSRKELSEVSNSETTIYPNPTSGEFTVEGNTEEETTISIYNLNGSLVAETITNEPATNFNADGALASGIYIVKITNGTITTTEKLVVQ